MPPTSIKVSKYFDRKYINTKQLYYLVQRLRFGRSVTRNRVKWEQMEKQTDRRMKESSEMEHLLLKGEPDVQWNKTRWKT